MPVALALAYGEVTRKKPSAAMIVPTDLQHRLEQHSFQADTSSWLIGDIAVILEDEYSVIKDGKTIHTVPRAELHRAIGVFAHRGSETIRDYAWLSRLVPDELRGEYDMLGRHAHRAIAVVAKGDIEKHRELCNKWLAKADDFGGSIGSVGALRMWLKDRRHTPKPWESRLERAKSLCASLAADKEAPPSVQAAASGFLAAVG